MKLKPFSCFALMLLTGSSAVMANSNHAIDPLLIERNKVINQYITDLQQADYKAIALLFEKNAVVISTSRGQVNAKEFFYAFLPNVKTANTELHQTFVSQTDNNCYAARFHLDFKLKDGETGNGEYVDVFVFPNHSIKLSAVYMFENLKFSMQGDK